ncbi:MAG: hypothetical protein WC889_12960 [Myxococcota bacterium]|jgi:hypothetical protein
MALIDRKEAAMRLARAIASDIGLYHEERIVEGLVKDTLFDLLDGEFSEGRELYRSRISRELDPGCFFFDRAIVDVIIKNKGHIKSRIW